MHMDGTSEPDRKTAEGGKIMLEYEEFNRRYEEMLINAIEHAINVSKTYTRDIIRAIGITPEELEEIGYDCVNFPELHAWANGEE